MACLVPVLVCVASASYRPISNSGVRSWYHAAPRPPDTDNDGLREVWRWETHDVQVATPVLLGDGLIVFSSGNSTGDDPRSDLTLVKQRDGGRRGPEWHREWAHCSGCSREGTLEEMTPMLQTTSDHNVIYVVQDDPPVLLALDADKRGRTLWHFNITTPSMGNDDVDPSSPALAPDVVLLTASNVTTKYSGVFAVSSKGKPLWDITNFTELGAGISTPAVGGKNKDTVYFTSYGIDSDVEPNGWLHAHDVKSGRRYMRTPLVGTPVTSAPVYSDGRVFVSSCQPIYFNDPRAAGRRLFRTNCSVQAFSAQDGHGLWNSSAGIVHPDSLYAVGQLSGPVVSTDQEAGLVYVSVNASGGKILALHSVTGKQMWSYTVGSPSSPESVSHSAPVLSGGYLYVSRANTIQEWVYVLNARTGEKLHDHSVADGGRAGGCLEKHNVPCGACLDRNLQYICPPSAPSVGPDGTIYVGSLDGSVYALRPLDSPEAPAYVAYLCVGCGVFAVVLAVWIRTCVRDRCPRGMEKSGSSLVASPSSASGADLVCGAAQRYRIVQKLGSGAYGDVYLVRRVVDGEGYAMKYIRCDSHEEREEALNEWQTVSRLPPHPNLIQVLETFMNWHEQTTPSQPSVGHSSGNCQADDMTVSTPREDASLLDDLTRIDSLRRYVCIVMPYMQEGDLRKYIRSYRGGTIPGNVVLSYAGQIASVLSVLHSQATPIIHRDLKPENILLADNARRVVVTDFGLARQAKGSYCRTHAGSLAFIAPELWDRNYSTGVDVWALGCICYAMVSLRAEKENSRVLWREASDPGFRSGIAAEVASRGYRTDVVCTTTAMLDPDRRTRPEADFFVAALSRFTPPASLAAAALQHDQPTCETAYRRLFEKAAEADGGGSASSGHGSPSDKTALSQESPGSDKERARRQDDAPDCTAPERHRSLQAFPDPDTTGDFMS
eukprot:TRINITY_DN5279_c5_g1_i1.p1 TRINITY_DN5279_c5_g1~~TRINITY_DN5279_c5_g1_i1.p1  ORF type:complete len:946 (+),score=199.63 TRINITY_DN5279_c5_g1_i1:190-3027(+)